MRRTQSIRKAVYALIVLSVFMVILRFSRPLDSKVRQVPDPALTHHTGTDHMAEDPKIVDRNIPGDTKKPFAIQTINNEAAAANKPKGAASPGEPTATSAADSTANSEDEAKPAFDASKMYNQIVNDPSSPPVIIFSKSYCPYSMRAKQLLLETYTITPAPKVVELDQVTHGPELQEYLGETTKRRTVPNIIVNGVSRGGASEMVEFGDDLKAKLLEWGEGKLTVRKEEAVVQA